jgi:ABC-type sulfate/molybdate transport systems ATPase subunit
MAEPVRSRRVGEAVLEVRALRVVRGGRAILDGFDLRIERGEPFGIAGPSGSGKTTLLFAVAGLSPPDGGTIEVGGVSLDGLAPHERAERVGIVFQDYQLFPHLTAMQNACLAPALHGVEGHEGRVRELFDALGLAELGDRAPHELSGGQKQRVAIARTLALRPEVVLFDEPSAALDPSTTDELARILRSLSHETQVIVVSHDLPFLERCCTRGLRLEAGQIAASGTVADITRSA